MHFINTQHLHLQFTLGQQKQSNMPSVTLSSVSGPSLEATSKKKSVLFQAGATYYLGSPETGPLFTGLTVQQSQWNTDA